MAVKSKFFRVGVEGATTDGRNIEPTWLTQMAATYNPAKYGSRVFCEHIRGYAPDSPFRALGDIVALKAEPIADGELKGKMALYAQLAPSPELVHLVKSGQKIYSSMEVDTNFAKSGLAYLTGLGVTDNPASLGTEVLSFAAQHPDANPFKPRKQKADNLFSAATEVVIEFEDDDSDPPVDDQPNEVFGRLKALLDKFSKSSEKPAAPPKTEAAGTDAQFAQVVEGLQAVSVCLEGLSKDNREANKRTADAIAALEQKFNTLRTDHDQLHSQLDNTADPSSRTRPVATGNRGTAVTDC